MSVFLVLLLLVGSCTHSNSTLIDIGDINQRINLIGSTQVWNELKESSKYLSEKEKNTPMDQLYSGIASGDEEYLNVAQLLGPNEGLYALGMNCSMGKALSRNTRKVLNILKSNGDFNSNTADICTTCVDKDLKVNLQEQLIAIKNEKSKISNIAKLCLKNLAP